MKSYRFVLIVFIFSLISGSVVFAQEDEVENNLLDMLERVPDASRNRESFVVYNDFEQLFSSRIGLEPIDNFAQFDALSDDQRSLWLNTFSGMVYPPKWFQFIMMTMQDMEEQAGFGLFDMQQMVEYGQVPAMASLIKADINRDVLLASLAAYDYTQQAVTGGIRFCHSDGCDGMAPHNLKDRLLLPPIIDELGRYQSVLLTDDGTLTMSPEYGMINARAAVEAGEARALADVPAYRAAAEAITSGDPLNQGLIQAVFLPQDATAYYYGDIVQQVLGSDATQESIDALTAELGFDQSAAELEATLIPPFMLAVVANADGGDDEITLLGLVYGDMAQAEAAIERVPARLAAYHSVIRDVSLSELFDARGMVGGVAEVYSSEATGLYVALIPFSNPKPTPETDGPSNMGYRLFMDMLFRRDMLWLATHD